MLDEFSQSNVGMEPGVVMPGFCQNGQLYTIKPGDTLYMIARQNNISLQSLINANPQISDPNLIYPGQVICIPGAPGPAPCPGGVTYTVKPGDTMYGIAQRYGVSLTALINANPQISNPNLIYPGQVICIPGQPGPMPCPGGTIYVVKPGDTMFEIARMNNVSLAELIAANPQITDPSLIYPGQMICVPMTVVGPIVTPPEQVPEIPLPIPMPVPPVPEMPMPMPTPLPTPIPTPLPVPPCCNRIMPPMCPMPVFVIPWDECPYRQKKHKKECGDHKDHKHHKEHHRKKEHHKGCRY